MDSLGQLHITQMPTILFRRYIDDIIIIADTQETVDKAFIILNAQSEHIKLTRERPTEDWLPFLNIEIRQKGKQFETKWYRKPSNKNILIRADSNHPRQQKKNTIVVTKATAVGTSSGTHKQESLERAIRILGENGYQNGCLPRRKGKNKGQLRNHRRSHSPRDNKHVICIPFITDDITSTVRHSLKEVGLEVKVVETRGKSLKDELVHNRRFDVRCEKRMCRVCPFTGIGGCARKGAIYQITCECGEVYVGETGRPLSDRIDEHVRAANKPSLKSYSNTVWARHSKSVHNGESLKLTIKVLTVERNTNKRRALEATYINNLKPSLNTKEELTDMVTTFGLS